MCQKALAQTVEGFWGHGWGQWLFLKFQKRRENEKKPPKSYDSEGFSWRRRRDLRTELRRERGVSPSKAGANKAIPPSIGVPRLTGYQTDQPRQKENPTLTGRVLFLAEKERFELSRRYSRPTPLAGAPLRPLEYFSEYSSEAAACMGFRTFLLYYILRRLSRLFLKKCNLTFVKLGKYIGDILF